MNRWLFKQTLLTSVNDKQILVLIHYVHYVHTYITYITYITYTRKVMVDYFQDVRRNTRVNVFCQLTQVSMYSICQHRPNSLANITFIQPFGLIAYIVKKTWGRFIDNSGSISYDMLVYMFGILRYHK